MLTSNTSGTASLHLRLLVAVLLLLTGPSVCFAWFCEEGPPAAYNACRGNNVINPDTGVAWVCADDAAACVSCTIQWCNANVGTFCQPLCRNQAAVGCTEGGGCRRAWVQVYTVD